MTKLPTESALLAAVGVKPAYGAAHAIKARTDEGLVLPRRGGGVFVTSTPTDYLIGRRVVFTRTSPHGAHSAGQGSS